MKLRLPFSVVAEWHSFTRAASTLKKKGTRSSQPVKSDADTVAAYDEEPLDINPITLNRCTCIQIITKKENTFRNIKKDGSCISNFDLTGRQLFMGWMMHELEIIVDRERASPGPWRRANKMKGREEDQDGAETEEGKRGREKEGGNATEAYIRSEPVSDQTCPPLVTSLFPNADNTKAVTTFDHTIDRPSPLEIRSVHTMGFYWT